jgi:hypothetical protein
VVGGAEGGADDAGEGAFVAEDLFDGEGADGENKGGAEDFDFALEVGAAAEDFVGVGFSVASAFGFAGEASGDGGHVDVGAKLVFGYIEGLFEPAEEGAAGGPGEGFLKRAFAGTGGLADKEDSAEYGEAVDDGADHVGAGFAALQLAVKQGEPDEGGGLVGIAFRWLPRLGASHRTGIADEIGRYAGVKEVNTSGQAS